MVLAVDLILGLEPTMQRWQRYEDVFNFLLSSQPFIRHQKSGIIVYTDSKPAPKPKPQSGCPLFTAIPVEIRHLIYRELLTTPEVIDQAHKQLGNKESAMLEHYKPIPGIDSPILRTCRLVSRLLWGQSYFILLSLLPISKSHRE